MSEQYLWDRSGEPDAEIVRLEKVLQPYRYRQTPRRGANLRYIWLGAAACLVIAAGALYWMQARPLSDWSIEGKRVIAGKTVEAGSRELRLEAESIGSVTLAANTSLRVLSAINGTQQLELQRGTMRALIFAPPGKFTVDTSSAKSIDLGCAYTLSVLPDRTGMLTVQSGWVAFQAGKIESFIPAGATCRTRPGRGPGLPYFESAPHALREALEKFDAGEPGQVESIVATSRKEDALTLWHLLQRTGEAERGRVADRFGALVPSVDIAGLRAGKGQALDDAWSRLGLGGAEWWRMWKHPWQRG